MQEESRSAVETVERIEDKVESFFDLMIQLSKMLVLCIFLGGLASCGVVMTWNDSPSWAVWCAFFSPLLLILIPITMRLVAHVIDRRRGL